MRDETRKRHQRRDRRKAKESEWARIPHGSKTGHHGYAHPLDSARPEVDPGDGVKRRREPEPFRVPLAAFLEDE